jgi:hypothetical protein
MQERQSAGSRVSGLRTRRKPGMAPSRRKWSAVHVQLHCFLVQFVNRKARTPRCCAACNEVPGVGLVAVACCHRVPGHEIDEGLTLLRRALSLETDVREQAGIWQRIGQACAPNTMARASGSRRQPSWTLRQLPALSQRGNCECSCAAGTSITMHCAACCGACASSDLTICWRGLRSPSARTPSRRPVCRWRCSATDGALLGPRSRGARSVLPICEFGVRVSAAHR